METIILQADQIQQVATIILNGGLVAFPTDTVFGLAVSSNNIKAIKKMSLAKGRPKDKPFPMMVNSICQIQAVANVSELELKLIRRSMPGALTMILNKLAVVPSYVTNGFDTIGVRMPDDPWILQLIDLVACPILVPSANLSGYPSCVNHEEVLQQLSGVIDAVVVGESKDDLASSIIDIRDNRLKIIRSGKLTYDDIMEVIDER